MQLPQWRYLPDGWKLSFRKYPVLRKNKLKLAELRFKKVYRAKRKKRFYNHTHSFTDREYAKCEIAKEVWRVKDQGGNYQIEWKIVGHAPAYNPIGRRCRLCTAEKLLIAEDPDPNLLNKRDELVSKCRHRRKFALELC